MSLLPLRWAQSQSMRCLTIKPAVINPSTTSIGFVVSFTRLMPFGHPLGRFCLFFDFQIDVRIVVSWQKCWPEPAQSAEGESTSTILIMLQEPSTNTLVSVRNSAVIFFCELVLTML